jgi:hypothetical protein
MGSRNCFDNAAFREWWNQEAIMPFDSNAPDVSHMLTARLSQLPAAIELAKHEILTAWGIHALSILKDEFYVKAHGGVDVWGIKWDDVTEETLHRRLMRLKGYRKLKAGGKGRKRRLDAEIETHDIGIDTGRLVGGLQSGISPGAVFDVQADFVTVGADPIDPISGVHYASYFDAHRQIAPDEFDFVQIAEFESIAERAISAVVDGIFGGF